MASFDSFKCIKNITLKLDLNNCEIINLIQILIKNPITVTERTALFTSLISFNLWNFKSGWQFTKLLTQILNIFHNFKPKNLQIIKTKSTFLRQISLKGDINYCNNHKIPIFHEKLRWKSNLKLRKILWICVRSFVNSHPVPLKNQLI